MPPMGDKCSVDLYVNCAFIQVAQIEAKMIQPIFIHKYIYTYVCICAVEGTHNFHSTFYLASTRSMRNRICVLLVAGGRYNISNVGMALVWLSPTGHSSCSLWWSAGRYLHIGE